MGTFRRLAAIACAGVLAAAPVSASHMVTGNGFGFAVVSPESARVTRFYAHPYSFIRPDPNNPLGEGVETAGFIKSLGWEVGPPDNPSAVYDDDSHVIRIRGAGGDGLAFMPFGLHRSALILAWQPAAGAPQQNHLQVEWAHPVRSRKTIRMFGVDLQFQLFEGLQQPLLLIPLAPKQAAPAQPGHELDASPAWALISLDGPADLKPAAQDFHRWQAGLEPRDLATREIAEVERWRVRPAVHFSSENERHLWRQSEIMLRMAQSREPNLPGRYNNGLIVACLPDGIFFTPWVRDMAYATLAFARMGHRDEARAALMAWFNARPTGKMRQQTRGADYQISVVRYFGDGAEEPFFTMEGGTNIEFDDWGLALWVLAEYQRTFNDTAFLHTSSYRGPLYDSARDFIVKPLLANLEKFGPGLIVAADTSIWEERQKDQKHFAFSTAAAIVGLRGFAELARQTGDEPTRAHVLEQVALLEKGFHAAFIREGKLRGTLEEGVKNDIDGALLPIINFGVVTDRPTILDAVARMELLKVASGGYRRVRGTYTDPAIYEYWYEKQEFLFVDFSLAELLRRLGSGDQADAMLKRIVDKSAADHNIIPEMFVAEDCQLFHGAVGDPTGALPMVGYGAGVYILHLIEREALPGNHGSF